MDIEVGRRAALTAKVISWVINFSVMGVVIAYTLLQAGDLRPGAGIPEGSLDVAKWAVVTCVGLASVAFSFYRTLDQPGEKGLMQLVRAAGSRFVVAAFCLLIVLAVGQWTMLLAEMPGAASDPPIDQLVLPALMMVPLYFAFLHVIMGVTQLAAVVLTTYDMD